MRILRARYADGEDFLRHYQPSFPDGGIFFPTRAALDAGLPVLLEIRLPPIPQKMLIRGRIAWRRPGRHRTKLRAGLGIEFHTADTGRRDFLLSVARGDSLPGMISRRHPRLPVDLPGTWRVALDRGSSRGMIEDIGQGGAFVRSDVPVEVGAGVVLELLPPGSVVPLAIAGKVAWTRRTPGDEGFGMEFKTRDAGGTRRLKELVRRLEQESAEAIVASETDEDSDSAGGG
jgi:Tfp pilus assembly protein PilZ